MTKEKKQEIPKPIHLLVVVVGIGLVLMGQFIAGAIVAGFGALAYAGVVDPMAMNPDAGAKKGRSSKEEPRKDDREIKPDLSNVLGDLKL